MLRRAKSSTCSRDLAGSVNTYTDATELDLAESWECAVETSIVPHTRTDPAFTHPDGQIAVEVVNTHDMEPETEAAYKRAGVPVAIVRVEWETIGGLLDLAIRSSRNFGSDMCDECEHKQKARG